MIGTIARKETTELFRDGRFRWGTALVLTLLMIALVSGWQHATDVRASHDAATNATWERWLAQGDKNPHSAAHYGVYAFKPITPLSLVDQGVNTYTGVFTWLEAHNQNPFEFRPAQDAPPLARFGQMTASSVLQLFVPLLIVLLGFSAVSGERESGTLRLLLSAGVRRETIALGKAAGLSIGLGALLVPAALIGAFALLMTADVKQVISLPRVALLGAAYLLYFAAVLGVTLTVSAWARSSRAALVTLLGFWIVNALVSPRLATDVARALHPLPSAEAFRATLAEDLRNGIDGHSPADVRQQALRDSVLKAYGVDSIQALPVNYAGISLQAGEEHANRVYDRRFGHLASLMLAQERTHRRLGLIMPLLAVRSASMGLSGTDVFHHEHFVRAAEEHRRLIQRILNGDVATNSKYGETYLASDDLWASIPRFEYNAPTLSVIMRNETSSLLLLMLWLVAAGAAFIVGMRRVAPE
jgi:ABC-2 type transport system permease protein